MTSPKLFLILALSLFGFSTSPMFCSPQKSEAKKPDPPTKRLFIADYVINSAVGSAHTDSSGSTYGSAAAVGRNISLEATTGS
jgi:hypothetical protein